MHGRRRRERAETEDPESDSLGGPLSNPRYEAFKKILDPLGVALFPSGKGAFYYGTGVIKPNMVLGVVENLSTTPEVTYNCVAMEYLHTSCTPNVEFLQVTGESVHRNKIILTSITPIHPGEELTYSLYGCLWRTGRACSNDTCYRCTSILNDTTHIPCFVCPNGIMSAAQDTKAFRILTRQVSHPHPTNGKTYYVCTTCSYVGIIDTMETRFKERVPIWPDEDYWDYALIDPLPPGCSIDRLLGIVDAALCAPYFNSTNIWIMVRHVADYIKYYESGLDGAATLFRLGEIVVCKIHAMFEEEENWVIKKKEEEQSGVVGGGASSGVTTEKMLLWITSKLTYLKELDASLKSHSLYFIMHRKYIGMALEIFQSSKEKIQCELSGPTIVHPHD